MRKLASISFALFVINTDDTQNVPKLIENTHNTLIFLLNLMSTHSASNKSLNHSSTRLLGSPVSATTRSSSREPLPIASSRRVYSQTSLAYAPLLLNESLSMLSFS